LSGFSAYPSPNTNTRSRGALPRQFILEVLVSIQKILFPLWDNNSVLLLSALVSSGGLDEEAKDGKNLSFVNDDEETIEFVYLGTRLAALYSEVQNPQPRGWIATWLERRSGARYVMLATLAGVVFALFLGVIAIALSAYQSWLTYQQWKHPIE
jgi:hypothetical protein